MNPESKEVEHLISELNERLKGQNLYVIFSDNLNQYKIQKAGYPDKYKTIDNFDIKSLINCETSDFLERCSIIHLIISLNP